MDEPKQFNAIATGFITNINALRIFNSQIGQLARQHDVETSEQHKKDLAEAFGLTLEEMEAMVDADEPKETAASQDGKGKTDIALSAHHPKDSALSEAVHTRIKKQVDENAREMLLRIIRLFKGFQKQPPIQEHVLRRGALITLASYFEFLISELLHSFYARFPQALPSEDRVLSLSDLREIGSIEEAATFLVSKEIDAILRDSVDNQLQYFTKRPKLDISAIEPYKKHLSEFYQRRNIFVHNNGIVNKTYLAHVDAQFISDNAIKIGERPTVSQEYLVGSIDNVSLAGIILVQLCWRKWDKDDTPTADSHLVGDLYESLMDERYDLTKRLAAFANTVSFSTDRDARVAIINHAIALRETSSKDEMENVLNKCDWSSCSLEFHAALHALRGETKEMYTTLRRAIAAKEIARQSLAEWPLFKPYRGCSDFNALFEIITDDEQGAAKANL